MDVKNILIYAMGIAIFTKLPFYLSNANILRFPEYGWYLFLFIFMLYYYYFTKTKVIFNRGLLIWFVFYVFINALYLMKAGFGSQEYSFFPPVVMSLFVFLSLSLLYNLDEDNNLVTVRKSILIAILIGSLLLVIDFLFPGNFHSDYKQVVGRAVATYGNSNDAAIMLVLGLILTIDIVPKAYRMVFILFIFLGILATFSRGGMIAFFLITFMMSYQNKISRKSFLFIFISIITFLIFLLSGGLEIISAFFNIEITGNELNRISFFVEHDKSNVNDMAERKAVLAAALEMFANKPIFGNGFASTRLWEFNVAPHNTFAVVLAEFGIIGGLFIPLFLFSSTYKIFKNNIKEHKEIAILFIVYYLFFSMVSHNMLEHASNMAAAVILAILGYKNQRRKVF